MAPLRTLATAVLGLHMIAGAAQAQEIGGPNSAGFNGGLLLPISNSSCPWGILEDKLGAVDGACCLGSGEAGCGEAGGGDEEGQCTVACATKLLPLVEGGCRPILNLLYDTDDGEPDGVATIFDTAAAPRSRRSMRWGSSRPAETARPTASTRSAGWRQHEWPRRYAKTCSATTALRWWASSPARQTSSPAARWQASATPPATSAAAAAGIGGSR